mmetsp:Transcript_920/g.1934  ORF Transcript_920/g.1934 Transcript_920/m.1934 type:complete len:220 (-) Transcript_920:1253-1912(-)
MILCSAGSCGATDHLSGDVAADSSDITGTNVITSIIRQQTPCVSRKIIRHPHFGYVSEHELEVDLWLEHVVLRHQVLERGGQLVETGEQLHADRLRELPPAHRRQKAGLPRPAAEVEEDAVEVQLGSFITRIFTSGFIALSCSPAEALGLFEPLVKGAARHRGRGRGTRGRSPDFGGRWQERSLLALRALRTETAVARTGPRTSFHTFQRKGQSSSGCS